MTGILTIAAAGRERSAWDRWAPLLGHTPTGAFALAYTANNDSDLFVVYNVMSQKPTDGLNYETDAVLLYENDANSTDVSVNPHPVSKTPMPNLTRAYSFSTLPNGTVYIVDGVLRRAYRCTGSSLDANWTNTALWQGLIIGGTVYPVTSVDLIDGYVTLGGGGLPSTGTTCLGTTVSYAAIPVQGAGPGRFLFAAPEVLSASLIAQRGWSGGLPANLQGGAVVCFWGSDWEYRKSNLYLGCMAADRTTIEGATNGGTGVSAMYYLTGLDGNGNTTWLHGNETQSAGTLTSWKHGSGNAPCIGEHSVRWIAALGRFLLTYGSAECGGLRYRTAAAPWGPWTSEALLFSNDPGGGWMQRLIYPPSPVGTVDFNKQQAVWLTDPSGAPGTIINTEFPPKPPYNSAGNPYGPYQLPSSTAVDNLDGTASVFMNLSGFNPYVSWQMTARFNKPVSVRFSGHVVVSPRLAVIN